MTKYKPFLGIRSFSFHWNLFPTLSFLYTLFRTLPRTNPEKFFQCFTTEIRILVLLSFPVAQHFLCSIYFTQTWYLFLTRFCSLLSIKTLTLLLVPCKSSSMPSTFNFVYSHQAHWPLGTNERSQKFLNMAIDCLLLEPDYDFSQSSCTFQ